MTEFLAKLFIKNHKNTENIIVRENYGKLSGFVGIFANIVLFIFKIITGIISGSIAIIADALNNLTDAASSVVTLIGFKMSGKPADEEHPYGHARFEYIAGLVISFVVLFIGGQLAINSVGKIINPTPLMLGTAGMIILVAAILIKLWLCFFYRKIGKKINSLTVIAASKDSLNDVIATAAVLICAVIASRHGINIDGWAGLGVAAFILVSGIMLLKETANPLLGEVPDDNELDKISKKILSYENVIGMHDLVIHNYGYGRVFASVHVEMPAENDILDSHDTIDTIEKDFLKNEKINMVIHLDPVVTNNEEVSRISAVVDGILKEIDPVITKHDFRVVFGHSNTKLIFDIALPPGFSVSDRKISERINEKLKKYDGNMYAVIMIDRSYTSSVH
ncbi:MAG: cation transporter [Clostridia bacterium]|nr:cation transporter [Clostridia bacterium]